MRKSGVGCMLSCVQKQGGSNGRKETTKSPPGAPRYHRLTVEKRIIIWTLRKEGRSLRHIAGGLGCAPSTVSRELARNRGPKGYRAKKAQARADWRARRKAAARRKLTPEMWDLVKARMSEGWTPEQIAGRCGRDGVPMVCRETIYKEYYRRRKLAGKGGGLPPLAMRRRRRKTRDRDAKKYRRNAGRGKIPGRADIGERPKAVGNRARVGNWEGDLVNGLHGTGNLVTLAERMTRFVLFARAATKEADGVADAVVGLLAPLPKSFLSTLTFDNGKEFAKFGRIRRALGIAVYFAKPRHSWERGTNENRNGVVRKVLPKGRPFDDITDGEMRRIDSLLNDRPLKCLNWRTPREAFTELLVRHLLKAPT